MDAVWQGSGRFDTECETPFVRRQPHRGCSHLRSR